MTTEEFQSKTNAIKDDMDIDLLCMEWLEDLCQDRGRDGKTAMALLKQVKVKLLLE